MVSDGMPENMANNERLLLALAEELKTPLLKIAYGAELAATLTGAGQASDIQHTAFSAIRLIDSYLLSSQASNGQLELTLEPVALGAVMQDALHSVQPISKQYSCSLLLDVSHKQPLVMANRVAVEAALTNLLTVFIESGTSSVQLRSYRSRAGISSGVFVNDGVKISHMMFQKARELYGWARQPMPDITAGSGAGVFVADALFHSMNTYLRPARQGTWHGLAASFIPNRQLNLV